MGGHHPYRRQFRVLRRTCFLAVSCSLAMCATPAIAGESISLLPANATLSGPMARQQMLVERVVDGKSSGQVAESVTYASSDPKIATVDASGVVVPVSNGQATITATVGDVTASSTIAVVKMDEPFQWSFRNHVESVLTKAGCNSGACHGAAAGKNGFHLSLRGYDPEGDYLILTRQARGRRIVPTDPGHSLILTKPSGAVPHRGGLRFDVDSVEYRVLAEWIASGTPAPQDDDPLLEKLAVLPDASIQDIGVRQQLVVMAHFSDGHTEDVTRWVKFTSTNGSVAEVSDDGLVNVIGAGEGAITAWYSSRVAVATVTVPVPGQVDTQKFASAERRNFIDEQVLAKLEGLNIPPSPLASDEEFVRRAFIDTIGILPTVDEVQVFLDDPSADKRDRLIEQLLARPEFVDYWAYKWSDLLLVNSEKLPPPEMWSYYNWIRNNVAADVPWDRMVRELITATGSTLENGAACFYVLHQDPLELAETTTVAFLGMSINCARCHNHPLEKWTNDQYFAMTNLFARVRTKNVTGDANRAVFSASEGDVIQPLTGRPQPPTPLDGVPVAIDDPADRRVKLADWLTSPENPYFTRAITNRVWANFMGVGLVEFVDDMRVTNPASNEKLLSAMATYLAENHFDLKALMRAILQSTTYQRSSQTLPENAADTRFYSHYYPRRMMAEVLLDAIAEVTGVPSQFADYPAGWRAVELPDANIQSYFLKTFGRPDRIITCECERTAEPTMVQVLHLSNGDVLNQKLAAAGNRLDQLLQAGASNEQLIDTAYLAALARRPMDSERSRLVAVLSESSNEERRAVVEDLFWSILSSKEFLFNH